jgi:glycosyltransferase involved in cell wall biosynthesis
LTIAGGGPEKERLRAQAEKCGVSERIRFTGFVIQSDLVPLYQEADIFVLPAVLEIHWGIPNVLVEAAACCLPVITTALPSVTELIEDEKHGLIARDGDPADLADKIDHLASNPALRSEMGRRGRERVEKLFDIERTIESVLEPMLADA